MWGGGLYILGSSIYYMYCACVHDVCSVCVHVLTRPGVIIVYMYPVISNIAADTLALIVN